MDARWDWVRLEAAVAARLRAAGATEGDAAQVAEGLVLAEADGQAGHGLSRLRSYCEQVAVGKVNPRPMRRLDWTRPGALRVDADRGLAIPAIREGIDAGLARVGAQGLVGVAVTNSHHSGVAGHHVERAARAGAVCLSFSNTPAAIAPWGGTTPLFGTDPVAVGIPTDAEPLVVDLSMSKVARGKAMAAAQRGEPIPEGWAVDAEGRPTTDARAALAGSMLPMGDAKGAALVLAIELLATAFTGANMGFEASSFLDAAGPAPRTGQLFLLIDPAAFGGEAFTARVQVLLDAVLAQPGTRIPGAGRWARREWARQEGFVIAPATAAFLDGAS